MNESIFNLSRVHKINLVITISIVCLIVVPLITLHGFKGASLFIIVGLAVVAIATVNYLLPTPDRVKGALFAILPATVVTVLFFIDGFALNKHYLLFITIFMIAMYFDHKLIATYTLFLNICFVILFFKFHHHIFCLFPHTYFCQRSFRLGFLAHFLLMDS
mgnify:CR=1 FL=1